MTAVLRRQCAAQWAAHSHCALASGRTLRKSASYCSSSSISSGDDAAGSHGSRRFRQHVNPLAMQYREPIALPDWHTTFADASLPIHLDIGCARGKYLMQVAQENATKMNYVGVEIRQNVILDAIDEATRRRIRNLAFLHANMNFQQKLLIPSLPQPIESVSIFHPDPWMKKRHLKRRLVTDEFVNELADLLHDGTPIYVQTDVAELFEYMVEVFEQSQRFDFDALRANPFGIPTDREKFVCDQGGEIYRVKFIVGSKGESEPANPSSPFGK
uniref:tRNA (guanine(46)-N(7))-methyltransferase n=1 Tax=Globisporangium ultimum (strain ATCC 200006 / CBS 805.95 / DAOM BR144) TaxID=431595 RepID=K3X7Q0_GLOUD